MDNICKICNAEFSERSHFWREHKIKEKDYYETHLPKFDLFTKEKIEFKSPEQYYLADFNKKENLQKYLETNNPNFSQCYLSKWLIKRQELKNTKIAPSEFEVKSLYFPSIKYIIKKYGEKAYYKMCICGFLKVRYDYEQSLDFDEKINLNFLIDTREQNVITLPNSQIAKLNYGDYSIEDNPNNIFIERKSLLDFIGTLSSGFDRLKRELDRCVKDNGYLIMLIEEAYPNLLEFNDRAECRRVKATPDFIMHRARELLTLYPHNLQMLAVNGRIEAARIIKRIFTIKQDIKKVDLQYHYGLGVL